MLTANKGEFQQDLTEAAGSSGQDTGQVPTDSSGFQYFFHSFDNFTYMCLLSQKAQSMKYPGSYLNLRGRKQRWSALLCLCLGRTFPRVPPHLSLLQQAFFSPLSDRRVMHPWCPQKRGTISQKSRIARKLPASRFQITAENNLITPASCAHAASQLLKLHTDLPNVASGTRDPPHQPSHRHGMQHYSISGHTRWVSLAGSLICWPAVPPARDS